MTRATAVLPTEKVVPGTRQLSVALNDGLVLLGLGYVAVLLVWLVTQPMPALQDYGEWVFQGWAMLGLIRGNATMHAQFAVSWFPVPNLATQWLLVLGSWIAGPFVAAKVLVASYCVGATCVCVLAARRFRPGAWGPTFVLLLAVGAFNSCFWHGYANFQLGLMLFVLFLERTWGRKASTPALCGWGLMLYACHGAVLIAFLLLVVIREWRRWTVWLAMLPPVVLFAVYLACFSHPAGHAEGQGSVATRGSLATHLAYKAYTLLKTGSYQNLVDAHGLSAKVVPLLYDGGAAVNAVFAVLLTTALGWGVWQARRRVPRELLVFWGALLVLVLTLPADLAEVVNLGERFLYVLLLSMILLLPKLRWMQALGGVCLAGFALTAAQLPRCSLSGVGAAEAFHRPPEVDGRAYRGDGLFSHRLYQNDERRAEMRDNTRSFDPLLFDTWELKERGR